MGDFDPRRSGWSAYGGAMAALLDVVRFSLPVVGLLAAAAATVAAAFYGVTLVIEKLARRGNG